MKYMAFILVGSSMFQRRLSFLGASSGIGACTAVDFARCGAKLALTGRDELNLQTVRQRCIAEGADEEEVTIECLVQDCGNSSALAMELLQPCTKPSLW